MARRVGFIGKGTLSEAETAILWYIGRCIAALGHTLVIAPAKGTAEALRVGVKEQGGKLVELPQGVIETSVHTLIYPDPTLLRALKTKYEDIEDRPDVTIIHDEQELRLWYDATKTLLTEKGIKHPK